MPSSRQHIYKRDIIAPTVFLDAFSDIRTLNRNLKPFKASARLRVVKKRNYLSSLFQSFKYHSKFRAAFQFGVKMSDGRKTRRTGPKDEKSKLDRDWNRISQVRVKLKFGRTRM